MNRKLSGAERTVWLVDRADTVNAGAVVRIAAQIEEKALRVALNWLQKRHTMLRTRVDIVGGRAPVHPDDESIPPISLRVEDRQGNDHWQLEAQQELSRGLPSTRQPLVSVVLLKSQDVSEIILTLHHVYNDTATVLYLMRDLLGLLAQLMKGSHIPSLQVYPERRALDHLPSGGVRLMSSLMRTTALMVTHVTNVVQQGPQKPARRSLPQRTLPRPAALRRGDGLYQRGAPRLLHYALTREETALLAECCKSENASLHGAAVAAAFQAAIKYTGASATAPGLTGLYASSLYRPPAAARMAEVGLFVPLVMPGVLSRTQGQFWDVARLARATAFDAVRQELPLVAIPLPQRLLNLVRQPHAGAILMTGLSHEGVLHVTVQGMGTLDSFGVVTNRFGQRLVLSFLYPRWVRSVARADLLGAAVVKNLRAAMGAE